MMSLLTEGGVTLPKGLKFQRGGGRLFSIQKFMLQILYFKLGFLSMFEKIATCFSEKEGFGNFSFWQRHGVP